MYQFIVYRCGISISPISYRNMPKHHLVAIRSAPSKPRKVIRIVLRLCSTLVDHFTPHPTEGVQCFLFFRNQMSDVMLSIYSVTSVTLSIVCFYIVCSSFESFSISYHRATLYSFTAFESYASYQGCNTERRMGSIIGQRAHGV